VYQVYQLTSNRGHLLDNLTDSCITPQWRAEDILRTKFRLSLVLSAAGEEKGASERRQEIEVSIESLRPKEPPSDHEPYTDEDDMKLLGFWGRDSSRTYGWYMEGWEALVMRVYGCTGRLA